MMIQGDSCTHCNGVMVLAGKSSSPLFTKIEPLHQFEEKTAYRDGQEFFMVYKCSCCHSIQIRANEVLGVRLDEERKTLSLIKR